MSARYLVRVSLPENGAFSPDTGEAGEEPIHKPGRAALVSVATILRPHPPRDECKPLISASLIDSTNRIQRTTCQDIQCVAVLAAKQQLRRALWNRKCVDLLTA